MRFSDRIGYDTTGIVIPFIEAKKADLIYVKLDIKIIFISEIEFIYP